ncbi:YwqI/YxiC family protein [Metabacillus herbersteinensis]|uniref:YwqI/YxiC family protein n=1 Tax=Metabacillus herbersteinensis TaxID=283816 RepID=A0ABV6GI84_9BACI
MATIRLDYEALTQKLDDVKRALDSLGIEGPSESSLGKNKLEFTDEWLEREENLHYFFTQYVSIVQKNLEDTRANITLLKEQDEAIVRK